MTIQTPPITVEVVPRRGGPKPSLFTPAELEEIPKIAKAIAAMGLSPLRVTHSASVNAVQTPAPAPKPKDDEHAAAPTNATEAPADAAPGPEIVAEATTPTPRSRGVVYGLIALALVIGLGVFLWLRRKSSV